MVLDLDGAFVVLGTSVFGWLRRCSNIPEPLVRTGGWKSFTNPITLTISPVLILSLDIVWICSIVRKPGGSGGAELDGLGLLWELMFRRRVT
jgi:hypothetical protein